MRENSAVIQLKDLTKDYQVGFWKKRTVRALDHLSLEVFQGEIFGFLGPNGAGKTTTLKLLMQLIFPTTGTATILGKPVSLPEARTRVGYLPENPYFYDYLSGIELLKYTAALFGIPKATAQQRAESLLQQVGLEAERSNRQLRKYSKGMMQRLGIAQALMNNPDVIFLDEPMSGLDPIGRRDVRDLMLGLRDQKKTIFFSSHILADVEALCDRAAILNKGKLVKCGTVEELTGGKDASIEIIAVGINNPKFSQFSERLTTLLSINQTPNGLQLVLKDESQSDGAIQLVHELGGKVISIMPRKSSLEEFFSTTGKS
jgi:ABC-2 type transport system ATP-binding protein